MGDRLANLKVAILVSDGFEQSEMTEPKKALEAEGATVLIVSPETNEVKGWKNKAWGDAFRIDVPLESAKPEDFNALLLPGGLMNPDNLRINEKAVAFIKYFVDKHQPIAAICHGSWPLINAMGVQGRTMTSWPSLKADLTNAGATWVDKTVVRDKKLVTSRKPADLPDFNMEMIKLFSEK